MTIAEEKKNLRGHMLMKRAKLEKRIKERYDHWVCEKIWTNIIERAYRTVHCYLPMGAEIDINPLIERMLNENIAVVVPKTLPNRKMQNLILYSLNELEKGVFGTRHPANAEVYHGDYNLIIVPGLAFDSQNFRLGYGGGYYDTFLLQHPQACTLGVGYPFQHLKNIPLEPHDIQLTETLPYQKYPAVDEFMGM
ncbi:MAG: 5-formyltetrahydrofolate cyclo-ligase [Flavobacteriales bacterium]|nr:5-formyltetrahydrofolate cyclo-ligase [Flavobacteriales bacterium]